MSSKKLRFCANLNFLFCETGANALEKLSLAKQAGFAGVEMAFPANFSEEQLVTAKNENDIQIILLNMSLGNLNQYFIIILMRTNLRREFDMIFYPVYRCYLIYSSFEFEQRITCV